MRSENFMYELAKCIKAFYLYSTITNPEDKLVKWADGHLFGQKMPTIDIEKITSGNKTEFELFNNAVLLMVLRFTVVNGEYCNNYFLMPSTSELMGLIESIYFDLDNTYKQKLLTIADNINIVIDSHN